MASSWIVTRPTRDGGKRYRILYRLGGRESRTNYGGSFRTKAEAAARRQWVDGELAQLRVPNVHALEREPVRAPTISEAAERWHASRVDLAENTKTRHGLELNRIRLCRAARRVDHLTAADVAEFVAALTGEGYARSTLRKTLQTLQMVLDDAGVAENVARSKHVRLPREEPEEINPPSADHLEAVYRLLPSKHRLPMLWLDWSGARVSSVDRTLVGDYDEPRRRVRLRAATTKTRKALWWSCIRRSPTRSRRSSAPARIATRTRTCSRNPARTRCERRSRKPAAPPGSRSGRRMI